MRDMPDMRDERHERILATLIATQARHVARRRHTRRAVALIAVSTVAVAGVSVVRSGRIAPPPPPSPLTTLVDATEPSPADSIRTSPDVAAVHVERVGGGAPNWTLLPPTDPAIADRLSISAARVGAAPIAIVTSATARDTPLVDDETLLHHLDASGREDGLLRIDGRVTLLARTVPSANGG